MECGRCALREHLETCRPPDGADAAITAHRLLSSPAVRRFRLQTLALESLELRMTPRRVRRFLGELNAIESGLEDCRAALKRRERE